MILNIGESLAMAAAKELKKYSVLLHISHCGHTSRQLRSMWLDPRMHVRQMSFQNVWLITVIQEIISFPCHDKGYIKTKVVLMISFSTKDIFQLQEFQNRVVF